MKNPTLPKGFPTATVDINGRQLLVGDVCDYDFADNTTTFMVVFDDGAFRKMYQDWDRSMPYPYLEISNAAIQDLRIRCITPVTPSFDRDNFDDHIESFCQVHGIKAIQFVLQSEAGNMLVGNHVPKPEGTAPLIEMITLSVRNSLEGMRNPSSDITVKTHAFLTHPSKNHLYLKDKGSYEQMKKLFDNHKTSCVVVEIRDIKNIEW